MFYFDSIRYMVEHKEYFGKKFYKDNRKGYWISTQVPKIRAHRWVWINIHGPIPKGYHVHHKDKDKSNNEIENLELIHISRHLSLHGSEESNKIRAREMANKYRPLTKVWHASEEGRTWHKLHALKCKFGNQDPIDYTCLQCKKLYKSKNRSKERTKFCSNNCKSKWRRASKVDDIDKICKKCKSIFICNKYSKKIYCSTNCSRVGTIYVKSKS